MDPLIKTDVSLPKQLSYFIVIISLILIVLIIWKDCPLADILFFFLVGVIFVMGLNINAFDEIKREIIKDGRKKKDE